MTPKSSPTLNIVTITKNNPSQLEATFNSIKDIKYLHRWIIVNGGLKLSVADIARYKYCRDTILIEEPDTGISDAFNKSFNHLIPGWCWFLNAGDEALPHITSETFGQFLGTQTALWLCFEVIHTKYKFNSSKFCKSNKNIYKARVPHQGQLYNTHILTHPRYSLNYKLRMDLDFHYKLLELLNKPQAFDQQICKYEGGGVSEKHRFKMLIEGIKIDFHHSQDFQTHIMAIAILLRAIIRPFIPTAFVRFVFSIST